MATMRPVAHTATMTLANLINDEDIRFASSLADITGELSRRYFKQKIEIVDKPDESPVTKADLEIETALRRAIREHYPNHSIFGEEFGMSFGTGDDRRFLWVLDPIDGTLSFITGKPVFTTLIALLYDGVPILGIVDQPILKDRWIGALGRETRHNGVPVTTRCCHHLSSAYMYSCAPEMFLHHRMDAFNRLSPQVKQQCWGGDSYNYGLMASGCIDMVFDADMKVFDYMALVPVIKGAGGCITDWTGKELTWDGVTLNGKEEWAEEVLASANPDLHQQALAVIDWKEHDSQ